MKLTIGVMGSSGGALSQDVRQKAYRVGEAIAERDAILITGACPGLPYEAVRGAKAKGGLVVGISPGLSLDEHRGKYASPVEAFDVLIYTGSGLMGRELTNIRACDIVVIVGGRTGTLGGRDKRGHDRIPWGRGDGHRVEVPSGSRGKTAPGGLRALPGAEGAETAELGAAAG